MRWAHSSGKVPLAVILAMACGGALILCGWRELSLRGQVRTLQESLSRVLAAEEEAELALAAARKRSEDLDHALGVLKVEGQSLTDRVTNLEAQREHLRAEAARLEARALKAESGLASLQEGLEAARHALLEAQARPRNLEQRLEAVRARNLELEAQLDQISAIRTSLPSAFLWEGVSRDEAVFALSGAWESTVDLPAAVYLCQASGILLEGWLHRQAEEHLIGHVKRWRNPPSTLVKGEKVFILPRQGYEADH